MWTSLASGDAPDPPTPAQLEQWRRRVFPPDNEFPAALGLTVLLARTDDAAVGITQFAAFSTGFQFMLSVKVRQVRPDLAHGGLHMLTTAHAFPGKEIPLADRLLLGVEYSDGQRASTLERIPQPVSGAAADTERLVLFQNGGGGGGEHNVDQFYWVSPLPPEGPVTFVLTWQSFGMPESRTVVDGAAIRAAAERSQQLWPPQPPQERPKPPPSPRPSSGWFAEP